MSFCNNHVVVNICVIRRSTSSHGHIDRRPVTNRPIRPHFLATNGSGDELTLSCWHGNAELSSCNFRAVVSGSSDALVCESSKPWRIAFGAPPADTRWITTPWHVFNRSWTTKTQPLSNFDKPECPSLAVVRDLCMARLPGSSDWSGSLPFAARSAR